jgi:uncharacterized protein DUF4352
MGANLSSTVPSNLLGNICRICFYLSSWAACQGAVGPEPSPEANAPSGPVIPPGTIGRAPHYEMRASVIDSCDVPPHARHPDIRRVGVNVTLEAGAALQIPASPYYFSLIDSENIVYEATLGGCSPALAPTLLGPGDVAQGWISFDIPEAAKSLKLSYAPRLTTPIPEELVFRVTP